jgi:hypothetical protein
MYTFALLAINLDTPPTFFYFFQPASLASFLFRNFRFIFILGVGSLLSPLDLCKNATMKNITVANYHDYYQTLIKIGNVNGVAA